MGVPQRAQKLRVVPAAASSKCVTFDCPRGMRKRRRQLPTYVAYAAPWACRLAAEWSCQAHRAGKSISMCTSPQRHRPGTAVDAVLPMLASTDFFKVALQY